ncbi:MAG: dienelactone hydrolase family protein [Verrucomicrobia bacterium]|nr:dienelactone hydrolase family protein [Verrucomicrobiota bacterium]
MLKTFVGLVILSLLIWLGLSARAAERPAAATQTPQSFKKKITKTVGADYLLFLPKDYAAKSAQRWPLILFLHGAGERGTDLQLVTKHGPPKLVKDKPEFPFIVVSPQCPAGQVWDPDVVLGLLDEVTAHYAVDQSRVYLTGLSMGGYGTWKLAGLCPERFAAIAPICGGGDTIQIALASPEKRKALQGLGVWAFHGAKDPVVKLEESEKMVNAFKRIGAADVQLTIYPEAQHDSWTESYDNPALYEWLLQHRREPPMAASRAKP